jgi:hypothetical protein
VVSELIAAHIGAAEAAIRLRRGGRPRSAAMCNGSLSLAGAVSWLTFRMLSDAARRPALLRDKASWRAKNSKSGKELSYGRPTAIAPQ